MAHVVDIPARRRAWTGTQRRQEEARRREQLRVEADRLREDDDARKQRADQQTINALLKQAREAMPDRGAQLPPPTPVHYSQDQLSLIESCKSSLIALGQDASTEAATKYAKDHYPVYFAQPQTATHRERAADPAPVRPDAVLLLEMRVSQARKNGVLFDQHLFETRELPRCSEASQKVIAAAVARQVAWNQRGGQAIELIDALNALRAEQPQLFESLRPSA